MKGTICLGFSKALVVRSGLEIESDKPGKFLWYETRLYCVISLHVYLSTKFRFTLEISQPRKEIDLIEFMEKYSFFNLVL